MAHRRRSWLARDRRHWLELAARVLALITALVLLAKALVEHPPTWLFP